MKKKITWNAPAVLGFAVACAAVLALNSLTGGFLIRKYFCIYRTSVKDPLFYLRLFTHVIGHSDFSHFAGNMTLFLVIGPLLEEKYGSRMIIEIIAVTAVITGLIHVLLFPHTALLGASGIVFAFILLSSVTGSGRAGEIPVTLIIVACIYIGQQVWAGLTTPDNISQLTHIIGGAVGAGYGLLLRHQSSN